jgi:glycosyltransferase involved in cell wall biosynthesis
MTKSSVATIIVPLLRQKTAWLAQCLESALAQSEPCEVIVVRAAGTPAPNLKVLQELQKDWTNLHVLVETKPGNFPGAINDGIAAASTNRIGFLLSDDWLERDAVAQCLPLDADIVCTGQTTYYEDGTVLEAASRTLSLSEFNRRPTLESKASYLEHFFLFKKQALLRAGGLDETIGNFPGIDDYDLIWTLLEQGATVAIVEKRLYNYRDHAGERLTLASRQEALRNLETILLKHGIPKTHVREIAEDHAKWYGRPIHEVLREAQREKRAVLTRASHDE